MQLFASAALCLLFVDTTWAAKGHPNLRSQKQASALQVGHKNARRSGACPDGLRNRYPAALDSSYTVVGVSLGGSVWDTDKLREALGSDEQWVIGQPWILSMKVSNNGRTERSFGFMGGGGESGGFLVVRVPAGAIDQVITVSGVVNASAAHTEFQYRSSAAFTSGEVLMSEICLTPKTCKGFVCASPLIQKTLNDTTFGHSDAKCCAPKFCKDEVSCTPTTKYSQKDDFDTRRGSTLDGCCDAIACPADMCANDTKWSPNPGSGLKGSTKEECCLPQECMDYSCSDSSKWNKLPHTLAEGNTTVTRKGHSDIECCESRSCADFKIPDALKTVWKLKDNADQLTGSAYDQCCDALLCTNFTCPNNTQWKPKSPTTHFRAGSTADQCCDKIVCSAYTCSNSSLQKKVNAAQRQGSTDEECCEMKFCSNYKCSDPTKWVHFSDQESDSNLDRRGNSDEECCDKIMCRADVCTPATKWNFKNNSIQGSTPEQCCEAQFCNNYTCDTDTDGDGQGTQWYKRVDTNTFKWQGTTNEECCHPKYCSQYSTLTPTKWQRKPQKDLLGSTDTECYTERWCSDYCCVGQGWALKPNAAARMGSTDMECCTNQTSL
eukprot:TRINITY_DN333_c0_g1_i1.p1 TRINITY_DN333_c0_g1~~TRINITY_DN333_c0_g1_i1.p1  ORF type:complete len:606 (+),score=104.18 TRINITY_DN333_c0_g1_i1:66-1883(+)